MTRTLLFEGAQVTLTRTTKWSRLNACAMKGGGSPRRYFSGGPNIPTPECPHGRDYHNRDRLTVATASKDSPLVFYPLIEECLLEGRTDLRIGGSERPQTGQSR